MDGNAVEDNYRPTQGVNDRTVYHHDINAGGGSGGGAALPCFHSGSGPNFTETSLGTTVSLGGHPEYTADEAGARECQGDCAVCTELQCRKLLV